MPIDCLVVGGGPAGLAGAIQLGRLRRSTLLVDDDAGRSLWSQVTRNHLGFPDGVTSADLRLLGQRQAVAYDVRLRSGQVTGLRRAGSPDGGFLATVAAPDEPESDDAVPGLVENRVRERRFGAQLGERQTRHRIRIRARTVLLATGVIDAFPTFDGRDECVGVSLFWCIICDGYEAIGKHVAVVGDDEEAIETAFGLKHFTDRVTLVTGRRRSEPSPTGFALCGGAVWPSSSVASTCTVTTRVRSRPSRWSGRVHGHEAGTAGRSSSARWSSSPPRSGHARASPGGWVP